VALKSRLLLLGVLAFAILGQILWIGCRESNWGRVEVSPTLEDVTEKGYLYTPSTQSFLRGGHWLEEVDQVEITTEGNIARIIFHAKNSEHEMQVVNLPLDRLVPRLHYHAADQPDEFDAYNLMLAEYSRNSLSVPVGRPGDKSAHFESSLEEAAPWRLSGDYSFVPNELVRPIRVGVINNCLKPGLWELNASDRSGEIYHSWFNMPPELYNKLLAEANGVSEEFASAATIWSTEPVALDLPRLRTVTDTLGRFAVSLCSDDVAGYSSQDSRRKLAKGYVLVDNDGQKEKPTTLSEMTTKRCYLSDFVEPGKYSFTDRREFDLSFLAKVHEASVSRVTPHTDYNWLSPEQRRARPTSQSGYIELSIKLDDISIVIGNLPLHLLVPQEDLAINGFGVGVLSSSGIAERRDFLINEGPAPSFAYLCREEHDRMNGLNSHDFGIEQIFIRTHINDPSPWWEVTITSFERMVDLIKYRVEIPEALQAELVDHSQRYISPLYRTYRDDNLR